MSNIIYFFRNITLLINIASIVVYEYIKYKLCSDYNCFINNLLTKLSQKNILYIKLFQACALNNSIYNSSIMDNAINNKLIAFCDNAPWTEDDIDIETLCKLEEIYHISILDKYKPINTGMISLVYKAIMTGTNSAIALPTLGETIIVKIKRKHIELQLKYAIEQVLFCLSIIEYIPFINTYDFPAVMKKNINLITNQINFNAEIHNMDIFQTYCKGLKYIKIPQVYPEVTKQVNNVIIMEFVNGKTLHNIDKADYIIYAKQLLKFVYFTTFLYGKYHGDLHMGNLLFLNEADNPRLCILDFGIVYDLAQNKDGLFDIISSILTDSPVELSHKILQSGFIEPVEAINSLKIEHYSNLISLLARFIDKSIHIEKKLNHHNLFVFLSELNLYIRNIGKTYKNCSQIKLSYDLVQIQVCFAMIHGVILKLCIDENYIEISDQVMRETFRLDLFN